MRQRGSEVFILALAEAVARHDDPAAEARIVVVAVDQLRAGFGREQRPGRGAAMLVELGRDALPVNSGGPGFVLQHFGLRSSGLFTPSSRLKAGMKIEGRPWNVGTRARPRPPILAQNWKPR